MKLANRFAEEDKHKVWEYHFFCALCGSNQQCSLHHIKSTESGSILNSIMLCHNHHKYADGHNKSDNEFMAQLLQYTIKQALKEDYKLTEKDIHFYNSNKVLYNINNERQTNN